MKLILQILCIRDKSWILKKKPTFFCKNIKNIVCWNIGIVVKVKWFRTKNMIFHFESLQAM